MRQKLRATKLGKIDESSSSGGNVTLRSAVDREEKERKKRDHTDVMCYGCGKKGHLRRYCPTKKDEEPKNEIEKPTTQGQTSTSKADATSTKKPPSGALYTAISHAPVPTDGGLTDSFYVDSGAFDYLVPSNADLRL